MKSPSDDPQKLTDAELRRLAQHLYDLGVRPLYHFLREVRDGKDLERHLERYGDLDPEFVRKLGGREFSKSMRCIGRVVNR